VARGPGARRGEEPHARRRHPRIGGTDVPGMQEEAGPAGGLPPDLAYLAQKGRAKRISRGVYAAPSA
jgi:hypothetical protein